MKKTFAIVGCGFLGNIVADAYAGGLLEGYELIGVTSRTPEDAQATAARAGCPAFQHIDALLALHPNVVVETASVECVRAIAEPVLCAGSDLALVSIGAFADPAFYARVKAAAAAHGTRVHIASGAIGGFDVLQTVSLMAQAGRLAQTSGIETHTGCLGFKPTPVWEDALLTQPKTVFAGNAAQAIATFPRRVNVAVAASLATTGPERTGVTMHSVPDWQGDEHQITAEIDGVKAAVTVYSRTSAIAGWSVVALLRNLVSPVCFY